MGCGAQVVTENYGGDVAVVSVYLNAGSRFETLESSGAARLWLNLMLRGTKSKNRGQLEAAIEQLGGQLKVTCQRELIGLTLTVHKGETQKALDLLLEMFLETNLDQKTLDGEKENLVTLAKETSRDQHNYCNEALLYTSFREHMMGQPRNGNRDTVQNLTVKDLEAHRERTLCGNNLVLVVSGSSSHEQNLSTADAKLSGLPEDADFTSMEQNYEKPLFTTSQMSVRDDERDNLNVAISFKVPGRRDPGYYGQLLFQEIMGDYNANHDGMANVNCPNRQYNYLHRHFGQRPGLNLFQVRYQSFSDIGLFTTWCHGNEIWSNDMNILTQWMLGWYTKNLNQVEVFRARARIFNNLLNESPSEELNYEIA